MRGASKPLLLYLPLLLFCLHWTLTGILLLPKNPLTSPFVSKLEYGKIYSQGWGFFSPAPRSNIRLYYVFTPINEFGGKEIVIDVLSDIIKDKQKRAPFNTRESIVDYALWSSYMKASRMANARRLYSPKVAGERSHVLRADSKNSGVRTLVNYASILSEANNLDPREYLVTFTGMSARMPPFANRQHLIDGTKPKEVIVFQSEPFSLVKYPFVTKR